MINLSKKKEKGKGITKNPLSLYKDDVKSKNPKNQLLMQFIITI